MLVNVVITISPSIRLYEMVFLIDEGLLADGIGKVEGFVEVKPCPLVVSQSLDAGKGRVNPVVIHQFFIGPPGIHAFFVFFCPRPTTTIRVGLTSMPMSYHVVITLTKTTLKHRGKTKTNSSTMIQKVWRVVFDSRFHLTLNIYLVCYWIWN